MLKGCDCGLDACEDDIMYLSIYIYILKSLRVQVDKLVMRLRTVAAKERLQVDRQVSTPFCRLCTCLASFW